MISAELEIVEQPSEGFAMINFVLILGRGLSGKLGPKEACKNSIEDSPVGSIISTVLFVPTKLSCESDRPPKIFSQLSPSSVDLQSPLPRALPPVYISPVPA